MAGRSLRNDVLDRLIEVGKTGDFDRLGLLFTEAEQLRHPSLAPDHETWLATVESLVVEDLIALIKSLTVGERQFNGWRTGSVSPVIRLFGKLSSHDSSRAEEIAGWVLSHTDNPYLPYGSNNHGAKSVEEYRKYRLASRQKASARADAEEARKLEAKERKAQQATHNLFNAVRRGEVKAVVALLDKGADPTTQNPDGVTALDVAVSQGDHRIIELLSKAAGDS